MAKRWLRQRWERLLPLLESLGIDQEEEIALICAQELAAWRARPEITSVLSLREPMADTRKELRRRPLSSSNSWVNPRTGKPEHIALKYFNYTSVSGGHSLFDAQSELCRAPIDERSHSPIPAQPKNVQQFNSDLGTAL